MEILDYMPLRSIVVAFLALFLVISPAVAQQSSAAPPPSMIAWWPMDGALGTNVPDAAGAHSGPFSRTERQQYVRRPLPGGRSIIPTSSNVISSLVRSCNFVDREMNKGDM
jgi:hypothetical protein